MSPTPPNLTPIHPKDACTYARNSSWKEAFISTGHCWLCYCGRGSWAEQNCSMGRGREKWGFRVWVRFGKDMAESLWVTTRTLQSRMLPSRRWGGVRWESSLKYPWFYVVSVCTMQVCFFFMHERCDKFYSLETLLFILLSHLIIIYICMNFYIVARVHTSRSPNTSLQIGIIFKSNRFKQVRYKAIFLECWFVSVGQSLCYCRCYLSQNI